MCAAPKGDNLWAKQTEQSPVCKGGSEIETDKQANKINGPAWNFQGE